MQSSGSSSSSSQVIRPPAFFQTAYSDLISEVLLFASNPLNELSLLNHNINKAMHLPGYWRRLLNRDFGLSLTFINNNIKPADARIVYQRLVYVTTKKKPKDNKYRGFYETIILEGGVNFFPLFATCASYPTIDTEMLSAYLIEALNVRNVRLAERILLQLFPEPSKTPEHKYNLYHFVDQWTINIAIETSNHELLQRMLPYTKSQKDIDTIHWVLESSQLSRASAEATRYLNRAIEMYQYTIASQLLRENVAPNEMTLTLALSSPIPDDRALDVIHQLFRLVDRYPQLLKLAMPASISREKDWHREKVWENVNTAFFIALYKIADVKVIEKIYRAASQLPCVFDSYFLKKIKTCLLKVAVMDEDLLTIQSYQQELSKVDKQELLCFAISQNQLAMTKYFIQSFQKNDIVNTYEIHEAIQRSNHKNIVKYFIEEFKLFECESNDKCSTDDIDLREMHLKFMLNSFSVSWLRNAASTRNLDLLTYIINAASEEDKIGYLQEAMSHAIDRNQEAVARYLIEDCRIPADMMNYARSAFDKQHFELSIYFLSRRMNTALLAFSSTELVSIIIQMNNPNDALERVFDGLIHPESIYPIDAATLRANILTLIDDSKFRPLNPQMIAWLAAKLKIEIPADSLKKMARYLASYDNDFSFVICPADTTQYRFMREDICLDVYHAFYQQFSQNKNSKDEASSQALLSTP
jgi:hypothetical protein